MFDWGLIPISGVCAQSLHVLSVLKGIPLGSIVSSHSSKTCVCRLIGISKLSIICKCVYDCVK